MLFNRIVSTAALRLSIFLSYRGSGEISRLLLIGKCGSDKLQSGWPSDHASEPAKEKISLADILNRASSFLPQVVLASKVLALIHPPSFTWFTNRYYAPALGFLMFAVGVNSREKDFLEAFSRPTFIISGYIGQFVVKPLLGYLLGTISMTIFGLPTSLGIACMDKYLPDNTSFQADGTRLRNDVVVMAPSISKASIIWPARRLYRKRHSYTTKSNQYHVVKTLGGTSVMNLERESKKLMYVHTFSVPDFAVVTICPDRGRFPQATPDSLKPFEFFKNYIGNTFPAEKVSISSRPCKIHRHIILSFGLLILFDIYFQVSLWAFLQI